MSDSATPAPPDPVSLASLNSLRLDAWALSVRSLKTTSELAGLTQQLKDKPRLILGGGSNVVLVAPRDAPLQAHLIHNQLAGIVRLDPQGDRIRLRVAAGESWHRLVMWTLSQGWGGLENLALIPGTVGAAPIQNIGAYGVEVCDRIETVHAWDFEAEDHVSFAREDCGFGYRSSRFKDTEQQGPWDQPRYLITGVDFQLWPSGRTPLEIGYAGLSDCLTGQQDLTPLAVAHAVMSLRRSKLPDPDELGNVGSFFENPLVPTPYAEALAKGLPELPRYAAEDDQTKVSAAWLIDSLGFRGQRRGDVGVYDRHALVLVNHGQARGQEVIDLAREIQLRVMARYGIWLMPEPQVLPPSAVDRRKTGRSGVEADAT